MSDVLAVLVLLGLGACFVKPRGLLVPRRWRQRWRSGRPRGKSGRVSAGLRLKVLHADRKRCVYCGSRSNLQIDHIVPWIMGGLTWFPNLATLCKACNGTKGIYWVSPAGTTYYRAAWGRSDVLTAQMIYEAEISARRSPLRAVRAA